MNFLFWNAKQKRAENSIARLVKSRAIDVLVLAECPIDESQMLKTLGATGRSFHNANPVSSRLRVYTSLSATQVAPVQNTAGDNVSLYKIVGNGGEPILLAAVHLSSKLWATVADQREAAETVAEMVRGHEGQRRRTIVLGDFNMDPFEEGMTNANAFHALMSLMDATRDRKVKTKSYAPFYNPMWSLFGDIGGRVPGTYRYIGGISCLFWHMFDQVLFRPEVANLLVMGSLTILTHDGQQALLNGSGPDKKISDHLPIAFSLNL